MINAQEAKRLTKEANKQFEEQLKEQIEDFEWHIADTIKKGFSSVYITYNGRVNVKCIKFLEDYGYRTKLIEKTEKTETWLVSWGNYMTEEDNITVKRNDIQIPDNARCRFKLNGKTYTSLIEIYHDGYNKAIKDFKSINNKYKEGFNDGYKKGRQECTNSFNAGYDIGYKAGKGDI